MLDTHQLSFDARTLTARRAPDLVADALEWIQRNPRAWAELVRMAREDAEKPNGRVRVKGYIELLRTAAASPERPAPRIPNALSAPFGRILASWYPELEPAIPLAHSKTDGCSIPPRR